MNELEKICWDDAITAFFNKDCDIFIKYMSLLTTNRTLRQREEIFTELYKRLHERMKNGI